MSWLLSEIAVALVVAGLVGMVLGLLVAWVAAANTEDRREELEQSHREMTERIAELEQRNVDLTESYRRLRREHLDVSDEPIIELRPTSVR